MCGMMDLQESKRRHEEMLREAELNRLKKALRAKRKGSATHRLASIVAWELIRAVGLLRKVLPDAEERRLERAGRTS
jgi:hypothetical protein